MRVLVTGINGFVGCHLSRLLVDKKYDVSGTRIDDINLDIVSERVPESAIKICDLRGKNSVDSLIAGIKPEAVFHLAGQSWVPASWDNPAVTFEINLIGTIHLFDSVLKHCPECRILFVSTGDFYDHSLSSDSPADEESPVNPRNPYALSKLTADILAMQYYSAHSLNVVRLRPFNHIGPYQSERFVVSEFARQIAFAEAGFSEPVLQVGNLDAERDFTDVRDMVRAYELAIHKCETGGCYNISSQTARSIRSIVDILIKNSNIKISVQTDPARYRPVEVARFLGNSSRFRKVTGWSPEIPFETTVIDVLNYWRQKVKNE